MTDTKELLQRIAALRTRLNTSAEPTASAAMIAENPLRTLEEKVHSGAQHAALMDNSLRSCEPGAAEATPARMTGHGARVLRKGREMLQALRQIADDVDFQEIDPAETLVELHGGATAMLELVLRTTQTFSPTVSVQLRMCEGLEVVLGEIEERIAILSSGLAQRKQSATRINELADFLHALAVNQAVSLTSLQGLADTILSEAKAGVPLRFLSASPVEPARFAAAHCLTVAQVMARVLKDDQEWQPQLQLALMAALVHDVGMVRVPSEILLTEGPLDGDERRLIEKHTGAAEAMLTNLWPGGGWPVEAARDHHERSDGTGYPQGVREIRLAPYVRLLAACDVYAALCAPRPHRPAFEPRTALTEILMLAERGYLDSPSAERLLLVSFHPVGSTVELSDGAVGVVIGTHAGQRGMANPGRPIVQLLTDSHGQPLPWPTTLDLLEDTERSIVHGLRGNKRPAFVGKRFPDACG